MPHCLENVHSENPWRLATKVLGPGCAVLRAGCSIPRLGLPSSPALVTSQPQGAAVTTAKLADS